MGAHRYIVIQQIRTMPIYGQNAREYPLSVHNRYHAIYVSCQFSSENLQRAAQLHFF